jgi:hypothetical protein
MINPSDEQMTIINAIKDGYNVQVDAVAGSGKTTTVLSLSHYNCEKKMVQITYNSDLKTEVREKKSKYQEHMKLENLEIHNYHSFATTYYSPNAHTDIGLEEILDKNTNPQRQLPKIDVLVLDEIQDMNELYYRFILKILMDTNNYENIQILTLGDKGQGLYEFKGADTRYLTLSSEIFNFSKRFPFKKLELTTTYRITREIATFINDGMLGYTRLNAVKDGPKVLYIRHTSVYQVYKMIGFKLIELLREKIVKPDEIFILAPSVKEKKMEHVKLLENMLVSNGIPCYVPTSENCSVNRETIKNKVIFSSFHQSKGRERKIVVVFGFDDDYFKWFERDKNSKICPSTLYVATTRATETLILVECSKPLPFLQYSHQDLIEMEEVNFEGVPLNLYTEEAINQRPSTPPENTHNTSPTKLIKFLDENVLIKIVKLIKDENLFTLDPISDYGIITTLKNSINKQEYYDYELTEEVSDLNGMLIPAIFEERTSAKNTSCIRETVSNKLNNISNEYHIFHKLLKDIDFNKQWLSTSEYLKVTNVYSAMDNKIHFKIAQIMNYDWLTDEDVHFLLKNMFLHISDEEAFSMLYEEEIIGNEDDNNDAIDAFTKSINIKNKIRFKAKVDAISFTNLWEFKCTESLEPEHFIQLIIYAWIWNMKCIYTEGERLFKLMNIRTGEVYQLNYKVEPINRIMECLLVAKFSKREMKSDEDFIRHHQELYRKIIHN